MFSSFTGASGSVQREGQRDFQPGPDPKAAPPQRQQAEGTQPGIRGLAGFAAAVQPFPGGTLGMANWRLVLS